MSEQRGVARVLDPEERAAAVQAVKDQAFTIRQGCDHCDHTCGEQRVIVHSIGSAFGADWDLADVVDFVEKADIVAWVPSRRDHELGAEKDGRIYYFQVKEPS